MKMKKILLGMSLIISTNLLASGMAFDERLISSSVIKLIKDIQVVKKKIKTINDAKLINKTNTDAARYSRVTLDRIEKLERKVNSMNVNTTDLDSVSKSELQNLYSQLNKTENKYNQLLLKYNNLENRLNKLAVPTRNTGVSVNTESDQIIKNYLYQ
jgi:BMFP domain-containing protein YqiC